MGKWGSKGIREGGTVPPRGQLTGATLTFAVDVAHVGGLVVRLMYLWLTWVVLLYG